MSRRVAPLARKMTDVMQMIVGSMQLGEHLSSIRAWERGEKVYLDIRKELLKTLEEEHMDEVRDELKRHKEEIDAIKLSLPFSPRRDKLLEE